MKAKRRLLIAGIVLGSLLTLSPLLGMLGTAFGMMRAFSTLSGPGITDPSALSADISTTLYTAAAGVVLFPIGVVMLILSLVFFIRLRTPLRRPCPRHRPNDTRKRLLSLVPKLCLGRPVGAKLCFAGRGGNERKTKA